MSIPYINGKYLLPCIINGMAVKRIYVNGRVEYIDQPKTLTDPVAQEVCVQHFGLNGNLCSQLFHRVYSMGNWFQGRTDLVTFTELQGFSNVQTLGDDCFNGCTGLTDIKLPSSVTTILPRCFKDCASLTTELWIPKVTVINAEAFRGCRALKKVDIGTSLSYINALAFADCDELENLTIHSFTPPKIAANILQNSPKCYVHVYQNCINSYKSAENWESIKDRIVTM